MTAGTICSGGSRGRGNYAADHPSCMIMLLTCRQHGFTPQHDSDLDISLGEEWQGEYFLLLPNNPDWAKKGDLGQ